MGNGFMQKELLRIYIGESDSYGRLPLYEALLEMFRREGCSGVTVLRGIAGYGASCVYHSDKFLDLSKDLPLVLEMVEDGEKIEAVLPLMEEMMNGGLITREQVQVRQFKKSQ